MIAIVDDMSKHKRALRALGGVTIEWDDRLLYVITSKLDVVTNREWENSLRKPEIPTLQDLTILNSWIADVICSNQSNKCPISKDEHFEFMCETLLKMPLLQSQSRTANGAWIVYDLSYIARKIVKPVVPKPTATDTTRLYIFPSIPQGDLAKPIERFASDYIGSHTYTSWSW